MKKKSLLAFAFIITLFVSCDKEENSENDLTEISAKIVGDWNLVGYDVVDGLISTSIEGMDFSFPTTITGKEYDASLSFSKTPNKYTSSGSFVVLVEFEIQGQSYSQEETIEDFIADGEWALEEGLLIVTTEGEEAAYTIKTLTDTSFVLEYNLKLNQEIDGVAFTTTGTYTMTLEKNK
tara:strand:+ start:21536 stop:22072 length:537 start_codon:yes stop_codon:yes gene_type:complete